MQARALDQAGRGKVTEVIGIQRYFKGSSNQIVGYLDFFFFLLNLEHLEERNCH